MTQGILGTKLAVVVAHPDDESYLAAGTIHRNRQLGGQTTVICATAGERGQSHLKRPLSPTQLKAIRQQELVAVSDLLQLQQLVQLGLPDGELELHEPRLAELVKQYLRQAQPDYVISFAEDGVTGHHDHIVVGRVTKLLAQDLRLPLLTFCRPSRLRPEILQRRRRFGKYRQNLSPQEPNLTIKINPKIKWACLCCHVSQMEPAGPLADFPEQVKEQLFHEEFFHAEWLKQNPGKNLS